MNGDARPILIWGGSGHAKVLRSILADSGRSVVGVIERDAAIDPPFPGVPRFFDEAEACAFVRAQGEGGEFVLAIGGSNGSERLRLARLLESFGLRPFSAAHARAFVSATARIGEGCQVLAMAAVGEEAELGEQTIINTSASVDHECRLGAGVHIMPGATLAGCVRVDDCATVGSNATIIPRLHIGAHAIVGAGAVVTNDVPPNAIVVGNPARVSRYRTPTT